MVSLSHQNGYDLVGAVWLRNSTKGES